jgi:hypothetical protein
MKSYPSKYLSIWLKVGCIAILLFCINTVGLAQNNQNDREINPTLGLEQGYLDFETPNFQLKLVKASQTIAALEPKGGEGFDFTPSDRLDQRNGNEFYHLGDINLRLRKKGSAEWEDYSTASDRQPVNPLSVSEPALSAADLSPTLPDDIPLQIRRYWEVDEEHLVLRYELENRSDQPVEIGSLGIPMVFNNNHTQKSLDEAHAENSFFDPYIGRDAGYLQVTRYNGHGPALLVVPDGKTPFEAYNPLLDDRTPRGITFEGFYEWMAHSKAHAENEWAEAEPWNVPTSEIIEPGESRSYGVKFLVSESIRDMESTLIANDRPVASGIPGYVLPMDQKGQLFLNYDADVSSLDVEPAGALELSSEGSTKNGWKSYSVNGNEWGRARLTITYEDGIEQTINYKVIKSEEQVVDDLENFLLTEQWYDNPDDPFNRHQSVISYDYEEKQQVTEDGRAWIAGLSDEGGAGSWLAAIMKQLIRPDKEEIEQLETFVDSVLWGGIQYSEGDRKYGVRKSMFYYEPDKMPEGTYNEDVGYGGWSSWDIEEARSVGRSYNYPHVAAAYWVLYRLARNHDGLVTNHSWEWYLERAYETSEAMVEHAPHYAQFGQMEGSVFLLILRDLQRENWDQAESLEATMLKRAEEWEELDFPFGSEMPWDSTGQEEVYMWCKYFGFDAKAEVTLNAILAYMPTVPHWGYNGSARRYWDFIFAGKTTRLERQLHHYGSGLNAIPVLSEYRDNPEDLYLLRVGYGGVMGSIANITQDGFGPAGFHAYPSTLDIDGYSGDYGPGFYGHAVNTGTYVANHPEFGWLAFGGEIEENDNWIQVTPQESARSRVYLASLGLWLTLDAGKFKSVEFNTSSNKVQLTLEGDVQYTPDARLRIEQPAKKDEIGTIRPTKEFELERGAYVISLEEATQEIELQVSS